MNTEPPASQPEAPPGGTRRPRRTLPILTGLIGIAAILVVAVLAQLQLRRMSVETQRNAAELQVLRGEAGALRQALAGSEQARRDLEDRIAAQGEQLAALRQELNAVAGEQTRSNVDLALAEVEYLLILATHRLTLAQDPRTALAALEAADKRLAGLNVSGLDAVRAQLKADLDALRAVNDVDLAGLSLYLADLSARAESLELKHAYSAGPRTSPEPSGRDTGWRGIWRSVIQELRSLVVITRSAVPDPVTLLPRERYFLFHNLRVQIETARLAVLRRDTRALRASAGTLLDWLDSYFNRGNDDVSNVMEAIGRMAELELAPELPDISSSLETVRALIHERARQETEAGGTGPQS